MAVGYRFIHPLKKKAKKVKEGGRAMASTSLFIVMIFIITWLYISGEAILSPTYFNRTLLMAHVMGLLLFMTVYRYWADQPEKESTRQLRRDKVRGMMRVPLYKAIPSTFIGALMGGLIGWLIFNVLYGITHVSFDYSELAYLFIYEYVIVSTIETIMFVKIVYDIVAGTESKSIATDKEFSRKGAVISALSFATFHMGVIGVWNLNTLAWIGLWGYIFAYIGRKNYIWWRGKKVDIPFSGLAMVIGLHAFLNMMMLIYPLNFLGV